ncbi:hypothetical protein GCM10023178_14710 [Actinomadura luteofluorescens]
MAKMRVYELAKDLGLESKTVMAKLQEMGEFVRSASSTMEPSVVRRVTESLQSPTLTRDIYLAIEARRFERAEERLAELKSADPEHWRRLQREIGDLIKQRHLHGGAGRHRVEWLTGLWVATTGSITTQQNAIRRPTRPGLPNQARRRLSPVQPGRARPEALGRELEDGFIGLLQKVFALSDKEQIRIRKQTSGTQFGHDIEFDATDAITGTLRCHVECKNYAEKVGLDDLAPKLLQQIVYWENKPLDYFILISPRARITNELSRLIQDCNFGRKFRFQILIWSPEQGVEELFQLTPRLYSVLYRRPAPNLSEETAKRIARRWAGLLRPDVKLPESWQRYLGEPILHQLYGETDFESVSQNAISLGTLADSGAPIPGTLHDNVREWLISRPEKTMLLLAEFGDGKSFFSYELTRRLSAEFLDDPSNGWCALRIPLRALRESSNPSTLLQNRLDAIGVRLTDWEALSKTHNTLIILDGFDEMSAQLDPQTLAANINVLAQCIDHFSYAKILISSRAHFFERISDYEEFLDTLGQPRVLRIAPIPLQQRLEYLGSYAEQIGEREKFEKLRTLYDPIGLAAKPLFLQMIKETLPGLPEDHFNEVILYHQYVRDSLKRKASDLQAERRLSEKRVIENLELILEELAVQLHMSRTDYVNLRSFDTGHRGRLSEILWEMSGAAVAVDDPDRTPDARSRVGVRSLLKQVAGVDPEQWPVDFFHRSMREFFVARALVRVIGNEDGKARSMLAKVPLQPEIVEFVRLIDQHSVDERSQRDREMLRRELTKLAKSATVRRYKDQHLGGNALTLLYALSRKLPTHDWSGLALDYADLSGANLDGMCFRGSSLRSASLDNASLVGADFRNADLAGVQLQQTAPVIALTFDSDSNIAYAIYGDRSVRCWTFGVGGRMSCVTLADLDFHSTSIHLSPFGDLVIKGPDTIAVLSAVDRRRNDNTSQNFERDRSSSKI